MPLSNYKKPRCTLSALMIIYWQTTVAAQSLCSLWATTSVLQLPLKRWPLVSGGSAVSLVQKWTIKCDHLMVKNVQISKQKWQLKNTPFGLAKVKACEESMRRKHARKACESEVHTGGQRTASASRCYWSRIMILLRVQSAELLMQNLASLRSVRLSKKV